MKIDLKELECLYEHLKNNDELNDEITDFNDFIGYIIGLSYSEKKELFKNYELIND